MREDKQAICDAFCETLKMTKALGGKESNPLVELKYLGDGSGRYTETVRPIFADGVGSDGWYDVNVTYDSGIAIIIDITNQFIKKF